MDTIFVKSVKEQGPAQQAGLCTGDRLVKVNGESILGKTYSQVIALIQNSQNILELSIMPKDEDVLQLAYSQDAYLKGNEPYSGGAQHLPEPPSLCYSSPRASPAPTPPGHAPQSPPDNWQCRASPAAPPLDNRPAGGPEAGRYRLRSSSALSALDFHFANHNAAIASATLPPPRKSSLPASARAHSDALCHQALSDWYYSQAEAAERMSPRHRSVSQDRLAELGLGLALGPGPGPPAASATAEQRRREALLYHHHTAAAQDSYWLGGWGGVSGPGSRSCSESLLAAYAEYEHNYGRSVETLAQASALVSPHYEFSSQSPQTIRVTEQKAPCGPQQQTSPPTAPPGGRQPGQQVAEPQTRRVKEDQHGGPAFSRKAGHLLHQAHSFREPGGGAGREVVPRPQSTPALSVSEEDPDLLSPVSLHQEVVLRQKPPPGRRTSAQTLRRPVDSPEPPGPAASPSPAASPVPPGPGSTRRANGSLVQHAFDSLSSIPFIGSIKGRRSSYLLAITTERSKSCDEGLNSFREENRVFCKLPKRVKSFFTDGSLESLRVQEEARSKRHSTSELGTITFSDVRREGWLHYKQILTEKGKKVGGGMRPWKRAFSVLRSHSLFLYKDKREAVLHGAGPGAGPGQDEHPPISIRGCLVDIAYSETKRKHALRLTTQDFCEYLLQAEDRDDMLAWIRVIRENSKTDNEEIGSSRQALINKKLNDYRKHSLTGTKPDSSPRASRMSMMPPFLLAKTENSTVNRGSRLSRAVSDENKALWGINIMKKTKKVDSPKAFGVRLEDCQPAVHHKFVPLVVEMCCGVVEASGLEYTGIYRVPGNNAMVSNLQEHLNKGLDINTAEERWQDLNVISSLLKSFFRKLPEPLFTDEKYNDFIAANRMEDAEDRLKTMKKLIQNLPDHYHHTLRFLVEHLKKVADHAEKNKMEPRNLALVFGPTLVRTSEDNMTDMVTHMADRYKIVETLILHSDWFFGDGKLENQEKQTPEDQPDMQPVPNIDHLLSNIGRTGVPAEFSDSTTSDSLKSKFSSGSRRDLNARDFLPKSIISAVTRKRKKRLSNYVPGSSADEDSEHEPVKASNYQGGGAAGGGGGGGGVEEEHAAPAEDRGDDEAKGGKVGESREGSESSMGEELKKQTGSSLKSPQRDGPQRPPEAPLYPHSCLYSQQTLGPPPAAQPPRGRSTIPVWISPTRPPSLYQTGRPQPDRGPLQPDRGPLQPDRGPLQPDRGPLQPDWGPPVALRSRKARSGRARAVSMNLDLSYEWRTDKVEVVRVIEAGGPRHSILGPGSLVRLSQEAPHPSSQSPRGSSAVVLRRSTQDPRDKTRAWRRHTVLV
uniref:Rho GTPase activating protein 23 n=1 Tax=Salarias fasciatus TaxID=181472 RepID=A0A672GRS1_SALFA